MQKLTQIAIVLIAAACVAVADILIKKAAFNTHNFFEALKNPLIIPAILLYIAQIVLFSYVFVKKWDLGIVGLMQMVFYAAIVVSAGIMFFQEKITTTHAAGMALALLGAILMNL